MYDLKAHTAFNSAAASTNAKRRISRKALSGTNTIRSSSNSLIASLNVMVPLLSKLGWDSINSVHMRIQGKFWINCIFCELKVPKGNGRIKRLEVSASSPFAEYHSFWTGFSASGHYYFNSNMHQSGLSHWRWPRQQQYRMHHSISSQYSEKYISHLLTVLAERFAHDP